MIERLVAEYNQINFAPAATFVWSPAYNTVYYDPERINSNQGQLALLHELSHSLLNHRSFQLDIDLLNMEVEAWIKARQLATDYGVKHDEKHIEDCLETYRVWLYKRSRCPNCASTSMQQDARSYRCFVCGAIWQVALTRSLRPRRMRCQLPITLAN